MIKGVVFGKFYPPHLGHKYLIDTALSQTGLLTVVVTAKKGQKIPGSLRARWLQATYPSVKVKLYTYTLADDDDKGWVAITPKLIGYRPDLVFTAGMPWADHFCELIGAKHVVVEGGRTKVPISGTEIRENPKLYLKFLPLVVRRYFEANIKSKIDEKIL